MKPSFGRADAYDYNRIHALLYHRADSRGVYSGNLKMLALELGISYVHFTTVIAGFVRDGRLRSLSRGAHRLQTFIVADPVTFLGDRHDDDGARTAQQELDDLGDHRAPAPRVRDRPEADEEPLAPPEDQSIDEDPKTARRRRSNSDGSPNRSRRPAPE